ncbi:MAG: alpha/beta fold hydrolase [Actinomycetota bacterium]|nr:alpha/beta fold hydrolase [Actinomycetota bacterium]
MPLGFDRTGEGPTLVLLHPLGADRHVWDQVVPLLASEREVVTVDLPGFGTSPPLTGAQDPRALAVAVASFLDQQGILHPHVIGNSLGGWVALELALADATRAVTGIAPAGLWPRPLAPKPSVARRLARGALPVVRGLTATARGRRLLLSGTVAHPQRVPAAAAAQLIRSYATAPGFVAVNDAMRAGAFVDLEQIRVPATLVWPQYDRLIARPQRLPAFVQSIDLPDTGHIPMLEAPEAVARVLLDARDPATEPATQR